MQDVEMSVEGFNGVFLRGASPIGGVAGAVLKWK